MIFFGFNEPISDSFSEFAATFFRKLRFSFLSLQGRLRLLDSGRALHQRGFRGRFLLPVSLSAVPF